MMDSESNSPELPFKPRPYPNRLVVLVALGMLIGGLSFSGFLRQFEAAEETSSVKNASNASLVLTSNTSESVPAHPVNTIADEVEDDQFIATPGQIVGKWVLDDGIRREIVNSADGTAKMNIKFSFLTSLRYGEKLDLDLKWTLKDNVLVHEIVGGGPAAGKKNLIADFGPKGYFKVLSIADGKMHLVDFDDPPEEYLWTRVEE